MSGIILNGRPVALASGASLLEVALASGTYVPHLCHHPDLEPAGHCRLCMVEVEGRGLVPACQTAAEEGMRVRTESALVRETRRGTLELLLASHPRDCLSCAGNGTCKLQEVTAYVGVDEARVEQMRIATPPRPVDASNPFFTYDPNRCVLCGVCVRTCREIQGCGAIDFAGTGAETRIVAGSDTSRLDSDCESCGGCVARCPTGALATRGSERSAHEVRTTCTFCGVGCSLLLGVRGEEVVSARGDRESPVNAGNLCVKGRYGNAFVHGTQRLTTPLVRRDGSLMPASWDEALDLVAERLGQYRGDPFAGIGSSRCTNEENYLMQKFVRVVMGTNNVDNCARLCHAPTLSGLSRAFGTGGGTNPIADLDQAGCILVIGSNTTAAHAVVGARLRRAALRVPLIVADPRRIDLCDHAALWLPLRPGSDVALLMGMARVIVDEGLYDRAFVADRCEGFEEFVEAAGAFDLATAADLTGVAGEDIAAAARLCATKKPLSIVYSLGITEHTHGTDNVLALANLAMLTGSVGRPGAGVMPMRGQNNVQGACDMGCVPATFPGYQPVADAAVRGRFEQAWGVPLSERPGLTLMEMLEAVRAGRVKALYVMGMDPAFSVADAARAQEALRTAEFVVFQDIFLTGSARFAHVVLPASSFAEKDGTFTNLERRVQRVRQAIPSVGESRPDGWIIAEIARRMGASGFEHVDAAAVLDEVARVTPSFAGLSFARLEAEGLQWPCPGSEHPGTPRLHVERFNTPSGLGRLAPLRYRPPAEEADAEYPFVLTTGRSLYHFHLAMTCHVPGLMALHPEEQIWIHPADAERLGVSAGGRVRVTSRRGQLTVGTRITGEVRPGTAFMTFHFYDTPTNVLTSAALDPVAKTPEYKVTAVRIEAVD